MKKNEFKMAYLCGGGVLLTLAIAVLCYMFPYTGDDWTWGSYIGIDRLNSFFQNYNGRYLGNIIVLILTRSRAVRTVVMTASILGIAYLITKLSDCSWWVLLAAIALIFAAPKAMFRQSIVWTAGFSNYATSAILFLVCAVLVKYSLQDNIAGLKGRKAISSILIFIMGYLGSLVIEHVTLMQLALSGILVGFIWWKYKKINLVCVFYFVGAVLGTLTMFSNECYSSIAAGKDSIRTVATGTNELFARAWQNYFDEIGKQMILDNVVLEVLLAVIVTILFVERYKDAGENGRKRAVSKASLMILDLSVFYGLVTRINPLWDRSLGRGKCLDGCVNVAFWCALIVFTFCVVADEMIKNRMIYILLGIACANGSLLFVTPIGPRCFFVTYVLTIWYCAECLFILNLNGATKRFVIQMTVMMTMFVLLMNFVIYRRTYVEDQERLRMVWKAYENGESSVTVPRLSYNDYVHYSDLHGVWSERYKLFYGIPMELEIDSEDS